MDASWKWHLPLVLAVSAAFEGVFLRQWINVMDEGWPLHAAMRLHRGGTLYDDVFWVFPPGHVLAAWIGYGVDPPGLTGSRLVYAAFTVALCGALTLLGRRFLQPSFALLAGLLVAVAAPRSHQFHLLFGYRYLVLAVVSLLLLDTALRRGDRRILFASGVLTGCALAFRLTPAFAAAVAVGVVLLAWHRDSRDWLRDGLVYALGVLAVALPVVAWFAASVGLETLWLEAVVRPVVMTELQSKPVPGLFWPAASRDAISRAFAAVQFRAWAALYLGMGVWLFVEWLRARRARRAFGHRVLLSVVVFGGVFFTRSLGRSDEPHLYSALPPACLLLAWCVESATARLGVRTDRRAMRGVVIAGVLALWVFLMGSDRYLAPGFMGRMPLASTGNATRVDPLRPVGRLDEVVAAISERSRPGDTILNMHNSPMLHVLADRLGPGTRDLIMPGTFLDEGEEREFVASLEARPPAVVVMPTHPFDGMEERSLEHSAPRVLAWVEARYRPVGRPMKKWQIYAPR